MPGSIYRQERYRGLAAVRYGIKKRNPESDLF